MTFTTEQARAAALAAHKKYGSKHMTEKARETFMARFKTAEEKTAYYTRLGKLRQKAKR